MKTKEQILEEMTTAENLRNEMLNSSLVDKDKVLATVKNGIKRYGYCLVWEPYSRPSEIHYGDSNIETSKPSETTAIKEICRAEGFYIKPAYHPISGRCYGFEVSL